MLDSAQQVAIVSKDGEELPNEPCAQSPIQESLQEEASSSMDLLDDKTLTQITAACHSGDCNRVLELVEESARPRDMAQRALNNAVVTGHLGVVKALVAARADVSSPSGKGHTPLFGAAYSGLVGMTEYLLAQRADPNSTSKNKRTPLMYASESERNSTQLMRTLLCAKAEINHKDDDGFTALIMASSRGDLDVVQTLLRERADPDHRDGDGLTARDIAQSMGYSQIVTCLNQRSECLRKVSLRKAKVAGSRARAEKDGGEASSVEDTRDLEAMLLAIDESSSENTKAGSHELGKPSASRSKAKTKP